MVTLMPCNYLSGAPQAARCSLDKMAEPKAKRARTDAGTADVSDRLSGVNDSPCSDSTCESPPALLPDATLPALLVSGASSLFHSSLHTSSAAAGLSISAADGLCHPGGGLHESASVDNTGAANGCLQGNNLSILSSLALPLTSGGIGSSTSSSSAVAWLMNEDSAGISGVKTEVRSPALCDAEAALAHDAALYCGDALPYDQSALPYQYYNSMQQYGGGGATSSYANSAALYNQSPYSAYPPAHNPIPRSSCKAAPTYLSAYGVGGVGGVGGASSFGSAAQASPYSAYSSYNGGFAQAFPTQQDYGGYASYGEHGAAAQYGGYYAAPSYSPYVSSPSSSGSAGHASYHLGAALSGQYI